MTNFGTWMLRVLGWKMIDTADPHPTSSVICVAPHTSNWDFTLGKLYYWAKGRHAGFLMKKEWFVFPLSLILRGMGGIPIDRSKKGSIVEHVMNFFKRRPNSHIAITPEGTRKKSTTWHKGFWFIAKGAGVPIQLAVIDYGKKELGIFEVFYPTDDMDADIRYIRSRYKAEHAKFPHKFGTE